LFRRLLPTLDRIFARGLVDDRMRATGISSH
jgi:hypothetical protein